VREGNGKGEGRGGCVVALCMDERPGRRTWPTLTEIFGSAEPRLKATVLYHSGLL